MPASQKPQIGLDVRLTYYTGGGIARYVRHLAADLPALAPELAFTHFYHRGHTQTFSSVARRVDCWTPAHHRFERLALAAEIWPYRLQMLHSPDFIPPAGGYQCALITVHDLTFLRYPQFLTAASRRHYNGHIRWAVAKAEAISADSEATRADLINLLGVPPGKITTIPLGLEPQYCPQPGPEDAATLRRLGLGAGYILFVGTFEPRKNVDGLLAAYAGLRRRAPDAPRLVLVGRRGWLFENSVARLRELGLEPHVTLLEELAEADLPALYRSAAVFALLSHYEGFGFTLLEALGSGVPAVIANRASLPELAGQAALAVEPDDSEAAAEAMLRALGDSALRAAMIEQGLARATAFTWDRTARATLDLYQSVLSR